MSRLGPPRFDWRAATAFMGLAVVKFAACACAFGCGAVLSILAASHMAAFRHRFHYDPETYLPSTVVGTMLEVEFRAYMLELAGIALQGIGLGGAAVGAKRVLSAAFAHFARRQR